MRTAPPPDTAAGAGVRPRRAALAALAAVTAALVAGCGSNEPANRATHDDNGARSSPGLRTFVGEVAGAGAFIALEQRADRVLAYICNGKLGLRRASEWFPRRAASDGRIELRSAGGARLRARLTAHAAAGEVVLNGRRYRFDSSPATGVAGLYRVKVSQGRLTGRSPRGGRMHGRIRAANRADGIYRVPTKVSGPGGVTAVLEPTASNTGSSISRFIVLADGRAKGSKTRGSGFVQQDVGI